MANPAPSPAGEIRLFVIVPVYGNWEDTHDCLAALAAQTCGQFEVLVADDGSPVPPPACVGQFPFVRYTRRSHRGFAANCNAGRWPTAN